MSPDRQNDDGREIRHNGGPRSGYDRSVQEKLKTITTDFQHYTVNNFETIPQVQSLPEDMRFAVKVVAQVLPFKVNRYVVDELIDWSNIPDDPMFQLTFPQKGMLSEDDFNKVADLLRKGDRDRLKQVVNQIRFSMNPHPAEQLESNVPMFGDDPLQGVQHKYRETALFFPAAGQTCHSYCTYCFRWAQFVGLSDLKFASREAETFANYLRQHHDISDVLFTGGDPMVMKTRVFKRYLEPLLDESLEHVQTIRIGTKSLAYWPQRFVTDDDADEFLQLIEKLVQSGKHVAVMAHFNHWAELQTPMVEEAIRRLRNAGVTIRTQSPVVKHINDSAEVWERMWRKQVSLGLVPYYMFVERDTGPKNYFEVPLVRALDIYQTAIRKLSGLARTARGPSMSATPGKIEVQGITEINGDKVFVLRMIQARNPELAYQPFFAKFDPHATWIDDLKPYGTDTFIFEDDREPVGVA